MRVGVLQENLVKALAIVLKAVEKKPSLAVLGNILLKTEDARLRISSTDLEQSVSVWVGAKVEMEGEITLPAKTLYDMVKGFAKERVDFVLNVEFQSVNIKCGVSEVTLNGIDASEFPRVPVAEDNPHAVVPAQMLKRMLKKSIFAAAREANRPILQGVNMEFTKKKKLFINTADGYRMSRCSFDLPMTEDLDLLGEYNVPIKTAKILHDTINEDDDIVKIWVERVGDYDMMTFGLKSIQIRVVLLEGKFPDVEAVVPRSHISEITFYRNDMLAVLNRAKVFAKDNANSVKIIGVNKKLSDEKPKLTIIAKSSERGGFEASIEVSMKGDPIDTSYNIAYFIEVLNALENKKVKDDRVSLTTNGNQAPLVIEHIDSGEFYNGNSSWLHVIMPMSTGR